MKLSRTALLGSMTLAAAIAIAVALLWWRRSKPAVDSALPKVIGGFIPYPPKPQPVPAPSPVAPPKPQPVPPKTTHPGIKHGLILPPKPAVPAPSPVAPPKPAPVPPKTTHLGIKNLAPRPKLPRPVPYPVFFFPTPITADYNKAALPGAGSATPADRAARAAAMAAAARAGYASYPVKPAVAARETIAVPNQTGGMKETFESGTYML